MKRGLKNMSRRGKAVDGGEEDENMQPSQVRSSAPTSAPAKTKDSAIVTRAQLRRQRGAIERGTAWVVLVVSFLGSVAWLAGGWPVLLAGIAAFRPNWSAIIGGLALQGLLTFFQWHYFDRPIVAWAARIADAYTTARGYGPLVLAWLMGLLAARGVTETFWVAWVVIGLVSLGIAYYPESRLVD